jgi:hypothetical protein
LQGKRVDNASCALFNDFPDGLRPEIKRRQRRRDDRPELGRRRHQLDVTEMQRAFADGEDQAAALLRWTSAARSNRLSE